MEKIISIITAVIAATVIASFAALLSVFLVEVAVKSELIVVVNDYEYVRNHLFSMVTLAVTSFVISLIKLIDEEMFD